MLRKSTFVPIIKFNNKINQDHGIKSNHESVVLFFAIWTVLSDHILTARSSFSFFLHKYQHQMSDKAQKKNKLVFKGDKEQK